MLQSSQKPKLEAAAVKTLVREKGKVTRMIMRVPSTKTPTLIRAKAMLKKRVKVKSLIRSKLTVMTKMTAIKKKMSNLLTSKLKAMFSRKAQRRGAVILRSKMKEKECQKVIKNDLRKMHLQSPLGVVGSSKTTS